MKKSISLILAIVMVLGVFISAPLTVVSYAGDVNVSDLYFELNDDGTGYEVSSDAPSEYLEGVLIIPETYEGLPVVEISSYGFSYERITKVVIPDSVKTIGSGAFDGCGYLETIVMGNGVEVIEESAFQYCNALRNISWSNSLKEIEPFAFESSFNGEADITITLPASLEILGDCAFSYASISKVVLNNGLKYIGEYCFEETRINNVTIPASVEEIRDCAFAYCSELSNIDVADDNAYYCDVDGILYSKDLTELLLYPYAKTDAYGEPITSFVIPEGVKRIGASAFDGQYDLYDISVPDSLEEIGSFAFSSTAYRYDYENCDENGAIYLGDHLIATDYGLEGSYHIKDGTKSIGGGAFYYQEIDSVYIPDSVKVIGEAAFSHCALEYVDMGNGVEKIGEGAFYECNYLYDIIFSHNLKEIGDRAFGYCESIDEIILPEKVETIGDMCFCDSSIYSITLPDSIKRIGDYAFEDCYYLENVYNMEAVEEIGAYAFQYCDQLSNVDFGSKLKRIEEGAFISTAIAEVDIPAGLEYLGEYAFESCYNLLSVTIPGTLKEIPEAAFSDCPIENLNLGEGIEKIGSDAFQSNYALEEIIIPDSVVEIGASAFIECGSAQKIELGSNLKKIGAYAFAYAHNLAELVISDSVEHIGQCAFLYATNLTSLKLGKGIKQIDFEAFSSCHMLPEVVIPAGVEELSYGAFLFCESLEEFQFSGPNDKYTVVDGVLFEDNGRVLLAYPSGKKDNFYKVPAGVEEIAKFALCDAIYLYELDVTTGVTLIDELAFYGNYLVNINLPTTLETIGGGAFYHSYNLTEITIPDSVTSIGEEAFSYSGNLIKVKLPKYLSELSARVFSGCDSLTTVRIPDGVEVIPEFAFAFCDSLTSIVIPESVKRIDSCAFYEWYEKPKNIKYVFYGGDVADWSDVEIIEEGNEKIVNASKILPIPDGHVIEWVVSQEATVFGPGLKVKQCLVCGDLTETEVIPQKVPATPKITKVSRTASGVKIEWNWIDGADEVYVYRKTKGGKWSKIKTYKPNMYGEMMTDYTDTTAKSGTTYYYTVKAKNEAGYSSYNKTGVAIKYVAAPKLTKIANESSGVRVYWSKVGGADGYYLYRRVAGTSKWTKVATIKKGSTTSYLDKKASAGKTYEYIIKAYDGKTVSAAAAKVIKIKRLTVPKLSSAKSGKSGVTVKWGKVAGASGYIVYRKTGKGSWVQLKSLEGNTKVSYVDKSAKKGKTYTYTVRAYSGSYKSAYNTKGLTVKDKY